MAEAKKSKAKPKAKKSLKKLYEEGVPGIRALPVMPSRLNRELAAAGKGTILDTIFMPDQDHMISGIDAKKDPNIKGSQIPYLYNIIGDFVINPSTVSVSTFQRMMYTDNLIGACLEYNTSVVTNTIGEFQHPVKEIQEFGRKVMNEIEGGQEKVIRNMLTAMWAGFSVQEKVYKITDDGVMYDRMIPLPPSTVLFAVDPEGRVRDEGIMQYIYSYFPMGGTTLGYSGYGAGVAPVPGGANGNQGDSFIDPYSGNGDMDYPVRTPTNFPVGRVSIPKNKCVHYVFDSGDVFGNPYGRSLLRKIHKYYLIKDATLQLMTVAMDRKSTPLIVVYADARVSVDTANGIRLNAVDAIADVVGDMHLNTAFTLPGMKGTTYEVEAIQVQGDLNIFIDALEYIDKAIQQAMLIPDTLFKTGTSGGSYALGSSQGDTHEKLIASIRSSIKREIVHQMLKPLIQLNFDESQHKGTWGRFPDKILSDDQIITIVGAFKEAAEANLVDTTQSADDINIFREKMGLERVEKPIDNGLGEGAEDGSPSGGKDSGLRKAKKHYKHQKEVN